MLGKKEFYNQNGVDTKPDLDDGEEYCLKCEGTRFSTNQDLSKEWLFLCENCYGTGKVDWIKYARG